MEADYVSMVDTPTRAKRQWKTALNNPSICGRSSTAFRDSLPLQPVKVIDNNQIIIGLYLIHGVEILRVFFMCCLWVVLALGIALHFGRTGDVGAGFTVGSFILGIPTLLLAILAFVKAARIS